MSSKLGPSGPSQVRFTRQHAHRRRLVVVCVFLFLEFVRTILRLSYGLFFCLIIVLIVIKVSSSSIDNNSVDSDNSIDNCTSNGILNNSINNSINDIINDRTDNT